MKIDPDWLEEDKRTKERASCPVCYMVMEEPTQACKEGHALCCECYVTELSKRKRCPTCQEKTDSSRLQKCRTAADFIGDLRVRCRHGTDLEEEGRGAGGAAPRAKRAKLDPPQPMSNNDLRKELGRRGMGTKGNKGDMVARLQEQRRSEAGEQQICNWRGKVCEFAVHLATCGREEVVCPCPGCDERMARVEVGAHVAASETVHLQRAWAQAEELEEEIKELRKNLPGRADALTRVFTWSTDSACKDKFTPTKTFADGVRGFCSNGEPALERFTHWMGFELEEGPACTMHYKCSLLDKNDKVLRVVSDPEACDFREPPIEAPTLGEGIGPGFNLSAADKTGAVRADGSIKFRMVVHLYLPE